MRRLRHHPCLFVSLAAIPFLFATALPSASAQEAGKIIEAYLKAAGGSKRLGHIQTLALEGTFTTADGQAGSYTLDSKLPNRLYSELLFGNQSLIEAYNGKSAWHETPSGEIVTLTGSEGAQLEAA